MVIVPFCDLLNRCICNVQCMYTHSPAIFRCCLSILLYGLFVLKTILLTVYKWLA